MIINLTEQVRFKYCKPFAIERLPELENRIRNNWSKFIKNKSAKDCFDGDIFIVTDIHSDGKVLTLEIGKGKYSELIYAKETGELRANSLFVASYIVTSDNYFCFVMDQGSRVNTIGGMADAADFINGVFEPETCLAREFKEELGIDLNNNNLFFKVSPKYLKTTNQEEKQLPLYPIGVLYEISSTLQKSDLKKIFEDSKDQVKENNIKPIFYGKEDYQQLAQYKNKVSYIMELFDLLLGNNSSM